jgi:hypothetical protein
VRLIGRSHEPLRAGFCGPVGTAWFVKNETAFAIQISRLNRHDLPGIDSQAKRYVLISAELPNVVSNHLRRSGD